MNISMKKGLLALAGAVALAGAGSAQATPVEYEGTTTLVAPSGASVTCTLTLVGDSTGTSVRVDSATVTGPGLCPAVQVLDFPWSGTLSSGTGGGITTLTGTPGMPGTGPHAAVPIAAVDCDGDVTGISYPGFSGSPSTPSQFDVDSGPTPLPAGANFDDCKIDGLLLRTIP